MTIVMQIVWLFIIAIAVACVSWTVTQEEIFKEFKTFCVQKNQDSKQLIVKKFFYLFTCEYCFSHYVTLLFIILTDFKLLINDWRGYVIAEFCIVWIANLYMGINFLIRQGIKKEKTQIKIMEQQTEDV